MPQEQTERQSLLEHGVMSRRWRVSVEDTVGGWCIGFEDELGTPATGFKSFIDLIMTEQIAQHIVDLHNFFVSEMS